MNSEERANDNKGKIYNRYVFEKSSSMLQYLATHIDYIEAHKSEMDQEVYRGLKRHLEKILHFACLITAYNGHTDNKPGYGYNSEHVQHILKNGLKGYKNVIRVYSRTITRDVVTKTEFWEILEDLVSGGRDNQTKIHELLRTTTLSANYVDELKDKTEDLVMGELSWDDYIRSVQNIKRDMGD